MKEVTAFVGVRSGSERVKNKNIKTSVTQHSLTSS